jgi:F-type H+-transporting ATPase subunit b
MQMLRLSLVFGLIASPALAAGKVFFSLANTDFVVLIAFILFIAVLVYFKVPAMLTKLLDKRADDIRRELDEARALREEAQTLLASYERKQKEVQEQADRIVAHARDEAAAAAEIAKADIQNSVARRLQAAQDQIGSAEASAVRAVREQAITVAVATAGDLLAAQMDDKRRGSSIDDAIAMVGKKLH